MPPTHLPATSLPFGLLRADCSKEEIPLTMRASLVGLVNVQGHCSCTSPRTDCACSSRQCAGSTVNQPINKSINQSVNPPVDQLTSQSVDNGLGRHNQGRYHHNEVSNYSSYVGAVAVGAVSPTHNMLSCSAFSTVGHIYKKVGVWSRSVVTALASKIPRRGRRRRRVQGAMGVPGVFHGVAPGGRLSF